MSISQQCFNSIPALTSVSRATHDVFGMTGRLSIPSPSWQTLLGYTVLILSAVNLMTVIRIAPLPSPLDPTRTEWEMCYPLAIWDVLFQFAFNLNGFTALVRHVKERVPSDLQLFLMVATMLFFVPGYLAHTWDWGSCSTAAPRIYHNAASLIPIFYIGLGFGLLGIGVYFAVKVLGDPDLDRATARVKAQVSGDGSEEYAGGEMHRAEERLK
ncbi:uncharacterized protein STEHIDRAFT_166650 [Stereum hirsutum FP-91666 SS1]|uniref:uncharacterized protein n=1 Tax=Stereum hirsutum (strain FP-91666) TaxID=721885 RepID=UPI000440B30F|nr:uncharacterized protein STEHIDRAFT_166650 [Stereum hirsutum FP-91666 SS1]EIM90478.1 hypothetical protein STEHIDRAFT_166650 [Stereum hirsutum FP-91666 SS1]